MAQNAVALSEPQRRALAMIGEDWDWWLGSNGMAAQSLQWLGLIERRREAKPGQLYATFQQRLTLAGRGIKADLSGCDPVRMLLDRWSPSSARLLTKVQRLSISGHTSLALVAIAEALDGAFERGRAGQSQNSDS